jgi:hypothetical protein
LSLPVNNILQSDKQRPYILTVTNGTNSQLALVPVLILTGSFSVYENPGSEYTLPVGIFAHSIMTSFITWPHVRRGRGKGCPAVALTGSVVGKQQINHSEVILHCKLDLSFGEIKLKNTGIETLLLSLAYLYCNAPFYR